MLLPVLVGVLAGLVTYLLLRLFKPREPSPDQGGNLPEPQPPVSSTTQQEERGDDGSLDQSARLAARIMETDEVVGRLLGNRAGVSDQEMSRMSLLELARRIGRQLSVAQMEVYRVAAEQKDLDFDVQKNATRAEVDYPTGEVEPMLVTDLSRLAEVYPEHLLLPPEEFVRQAISEELTRPAYFEPKVEVKLLYILLDASLSMEFTTASGHPRHVWSRGVVVNLLLKAARGEAKYFMRYFSASPPELVVVNDPARAAEIAQDLLEKVTIYGDGTRIPAALRRAVSDIRTEGGDFAQSELLLISDGISCNEEIEEAELRELLGNDIRLHVVSIGSYDSRDQGGEESPVLRAVASSYRKFE